jgi:glycosyltransferase involved in cell wall biosynthesis
VHLLVFNLGMDADHPVLGHTTGWTNELARRCEHLSVVTMFTGRLEVDANVTVHSLGKELGRSEPRRLVEFYRQVRNVLDDGPVDACFAHMAPLFTVLFAPMARMRRVPVLLWYAHTSVTRTLRAAHALADRCVTATPASFPLASDKLFVVGHGIDTAKFRPPLETTPRYETSAVSVGRISRSKHPDEMIEAVAVLRREHGLELQLELVGGPSTAADRDYLSQLERAVESFGVEQLVRFRGPVPFHQVAPSYHRALLSLNLSDTAMDKAILESMACGCIPVSRNPAFRELADTHELGWLVPGPGPRGLAQCIVSALRTVGGNRAALVARLRRIVVEEHSLTTLADRLMVHLHELSNVLHAPRTAVR